MRTLSLIALCACSTLQVEPVQLSEFFDGGDGFATVTASSLTRTLAGTIDQDLTLDNDEPWLLLGEVVVASGRTLTIEAGATILGDAQSTAQLIVHPGARLLSEGTASEPVVFTSSRPLGSRNPGDWAGLVLMGLAPANCVDCNFDDESFGGDQTNDDSGRLTHTVIEFAGTTTGAGVRLLGTGNGTTIDHLQVHQSLGDALQLHGGTTDATHLLLTEASDDLLDWTDGYAGNIQYLIGQGPGHLALEGDNQADDLDALPRSLPVIANATLVASDSRLAIHLRRGTGLQLVNSFITDAQNCIDIDDFATWNHAYTQPDVPNGALEMRDNWWFCDLLAVDDDGSAYGAEKMLLEEFTTNTIADPQLNGRWQSAAGLPAGAPPADSFFEATTFAGAQQLEDWTAGWTTRAER